MPKEGDETAAGGKEFSNPQDAAADVSKTGSDNRQQVDGKVEQQPSSHDGQQGPSPV